MEAIGAGVGGPLAVNTEVVLGTDGVRLVTTLRTSIIGQYFLFWSDFSEKISNSSLVFDKLGWLSLDRLSQGSF